MGRVAVSCVSTGCSVDLVHIDDVESVISVLDVLDNVTTALSTVDGCGDIVVGCSWCADVF